MDLNEIKPNLEEISADLEEIRLDLDEISPNLDEIGQNQTGELLRLAEKAIFGVFSGRVG